ncbi:MAG: tetratricopeptide repeat protein [Candidatus Omnitrophota bacterium]
MSSKDKKARELYKEENMDEALSEWRDAQIDHPENNELQYNIGNALHKIDRHEDAYKEYEKTLGSKNDELKAKTYYNIGNTNFRMGKLEEAIASYEESLSIDPEDEDAKYNIELIKKLLKQQKQESQKSDSKDDKSKEEEKKDQDKGSQEDQEKQQGQEDQKEEEGQQKDEMSEEDAKRLLDALKDDEEDVQKDLRRRIGETRYNVEKDW